MRRRDFLAAVLASPLGQNAPRPAVAPAAPRSSSFDPWVEIHGGHLRRNVAEISRRVGGRPILAVIKNNGYGAGVVNVARVIEGVPGIAGFAVVKLQEAIALRDAGIRKPVLLMGPVDDRDLDEAAARDVMPMVYTPIGASLERAAARRQRPIRIHVCVDTGIGRVGVPHRQAAALVESLAHRRGVEIDGVMMTFSEDPGLDQDQKTRFTSLCASLQTRGISIGRRHAASSYALFQHPDAFFDMVRPGMAIYGVYPEQAFRKAAVMTLRPALALRCRVAYVKQLEPGESAGYSRAYVATRPVWVATLPVGHADGWPRVAARGGTVRIGSQLYPVIASVSASHTIVEVGSAPRVSIGDVATLFDWEDGSRPEDLSAACGASVYDLTMHLNPLLPRRVI